MTILVTFFLIINIIIERIYIKKHKKDKSKEKEVLIMETMSIIMTTATIAFIVIVSFLNLLSNPTYEDFNNSVEKVMEFHKPLVSNVKTNKNKKVKVYFNKNEWDKLTLMDKVDEKQKIRTTIETIAINSGFVSSDDEIRIYFYND